MSKERENRLGQAASAYLRSARHQPVDWHEWGEEAFARAQREDKPVLLDIGAVWCHWCHVMDRESYEDVATATLINALFIAIKVDRDERPDVDTRYQAAVAAISGQGGWPLTAFLTPEGKPYFGGGYFPPEERVGRPSLQRVLRSMAEVYQHQRGDVQESAESVMSAIEQGETFAGSSSALDEALLDKIVEAMLQQFDPRHGGFGAQPKFPHAAALDLLLDVAMRPGPRAARAAEVVKLTLARMAEGGIQDQLAGGFHRYSVDERWAVPHFEKMAYDNSELLRLYTHAFQSFVDPRWARVAASTVQWMDAVLSDRDRGGFFTAQDADESLDDDGDYYTWTLAEAEAVLDPQEFAAAVLYFDLRSVGDMQHHPAKNVLRVRGDAGWVAGRLGKSEEDTRRLLETAQAKMQFTRLARKAPFVDRTLYTEWNGLCISAYLAAGRALALPEVTTFALKSLDRVLEEAWDAATGLRRVVAYGAELDVPQPIPAILDDYACLATAALDAWEVTGTLRYFHAAEQLTDRLLRDFYDGAEGGFFDTRQDAATATLPLGALSAKRKPLQDAPTPAGNAVAAALLLRLHTLTDNEVYQDHARATLQLFTDVAEHLGLYAASYGQALQRWLRPAMQVCIIGSDEVAEDLAAMAIARFLLNKSIVRLRPEQLSALPPVLAETLPHVPGVMDRSMAVVCTGGRCLPPVHDSAALLSLLENLT